VCRHEDDLGTLLSLGLDDAPYFADPDGYHNIVVYAL